MKGFNVNKDGIDPLWKASMYITNKDGIDPLCLWDEWSKGFNVNNDGNRSTVSRILFISRYNDVNIWA